MTSGPSPEKSWNHTYIYRKKTTVSKIITLIGGAPGLNNAVATPKTAKANITILDLFQLHYYDIRVVLMILIGPSTDSFNRRDL